MLSCNNVIHHSSKTVCHTTVYNTDKCRMTSRIRKWVMKFVRFNSSAALYKTKKINGISCWYSSFGSRKKEKFILISNIECLKSEHEIQFHWAILPLCNVFWKTLVLSRTPVWWRCAILLHILNDLNLGWVRNWNALNEGGALFELQLGVRSLEMRKFLGSFMRLGVLVKCCKEFATEIEVLVSSCFVKFVLT